MLEKKPLIINIPVIHKGFLDFIKKNSKKISKIYLAEGGLVEEILKMREDIASLDRSTIKNFLESVGIREIEILKKADLKKIAGKKVLMINDKFSRKMAEKYFSPKDVEWQSVFLRWDADSVLSNKSPNEKQSKRPIDARWMKEAYVESEKSGCWWRQVGAVVVKNNKIILRAYNEALPSDYTPYQVGHIRDYIKAGEKQELSSTVHSEQKIIAEAAQAGVSLKGTSLYITHFPCPVCTKLIIHSGIKACYFSQGTANLDGEKLMKLFKVKLLAVNLKK